MKRSAPRPVTRGLRAATLAGILLAARLALWPASTACAAAGVGDPAPDFTSENVLSLEGDPEFFQLSAHRGQIVVMNFFAYW